MPDQKFCPGCGKPVEAEQRAPSYQTHRPLGITVLGILQVIAGSVFAIAAIALGTISGTMGGFMDGVMGQFMATFGGIITAILGILAGLSFFIAWALFSAKRWARTIVIVLSIIDLAIGVVSIGAGNVFAFGGMVLDAVILYYMWRPHVIEYFNR